MRRSWTDDSLHTELTTLCKELGYFPSNQDLIAIQRGDLANQISRRGGFVAWSERVGYPRNPTDSDFGWRGEERVKDIIATLGYDCANSAGVKSPFDLPVAGVVRVDVKTARFASYGSGGGWYYRIGKYVQSDIVVLHQFDTSASLVLPWWAVPSTNVTISRGGGKYAQWLNRWSIMHYMVASRTTEQAHITQTISG